MFSLGPVRSTESYHLAFDEALVVIEVGDENDNAPVFEVQGRPIVAAVPLEASFGYQVLRISVCLSYISELKINIEMNNYSITAVSF